MSVIVSRQWQRRARNLLKGALTGFVLGWFLALLLGCSVWLEMRVTLGRIMPVSMAFLMLISLRKGAAFRFLPFLLFEALALAALFAIHGFDRATLLIVPGCLVREGFAISFFSLPSINLLLASVLLIGNLVWALQEIGRRGLKTG